MNYGRFQLKELVVRYCGWGGSSRGARAFIGENLITFAEENPQIQVSARQANNKHPILIGRYINGIEKVVDAKNESSDSILELATRLRNQSGRKVRRYDRPVVTENPSIQGYWAGHARAFTRRSQK
ncbi:hypothetical protein CTAYLR_007620 [Chrysophaeum taylorii]|uniref:Large ribosomal subunit protein mL43 n=1 Tax=Chrysophaeum taylorii TaxID=2483200 RepID=A0AAD7XH28_9STRA|nr:hypothetical protein CTAYLR_007620 [Chrysophaeum taylorii]